MVGARRVWDLDEATRRTSRIKNLDFVSDKDSLQDFGDIAGVVKQVDGLVVSDFACWTRRG